jgi:hypothetical protein
MTQAVREVIITPMVELYLPPLHLRADPAARIRALDAYEKALAPFDRDTLQRAWEMVVAQQTFWVWPNPGVIVEACRQCQPKPKPPSVEDQPRTKALKMAEEYVCKYMRTSQLAKLGTREGWEWHLRKYVMDAAFVQAQILCGTDHIAWNIHLADELGDFASSQQAFVEYRKTIDNAVERGKIRVTVPRVRIRQWSEEGRQRGSTPTLT